MTSQLLKPYLRRFILQTHPDFFHHDALKKSTNAASLQTLYSVLQPTSKPMNKPVKVEFFPKGQKKKDRSTVTGLFDGTSEWEKANTFFQLCKKLDIPVLQTDQDIVQSMINKQLNKGSNIKPKSLTKEFAEKLHKEQALKRTKDWKMEDVLNQSLIMFDPAVNKRLTATRLSQWLPQLQPQQWWGKLPMLIVSSNSAVPHKELTKGILVIKDNMSLEDIQKYLKSELDESKE